MSYTQGRKGDFFKVISSDEEIFSRPDDLENPIKYASDYKLEEDEWFAITEFSEKEYSIEFLTKHFISTDYDQIEVAAYSNIGFLVAYQTGIYYFQRLSTNQLIQKKYFTISQEPELVEGRRIIVINNYADAIYVKDEDTLYFKKLTAITTIFKGINQLYKEATQKETEAFLENDFIQLSDEYSAEDVKKANRKRIVMAMKSLNTFTLAEKNDIFDYLREYYKDLKFDEAAKKFSISNEEELKKLLFGIEQRYYTTRIGNEKRLANSVTTI